MDDKIQQDTMDNFENPEENREGSSPKVDPDMFTPLIMDRRPLEMRGVVTGSSVLNIWALTREAWSRGQPVKARIDGAWLEKGIRMVGAIEDHYILIGESQHINPQLPRQSYLIMVMKTEDVEILPL